MIRLPRSVMRLAVAAAVASALAAAAMLAGLLVFRVAELALPFPEARLDEARRPGSALVLDREGGVIAWRAGPAACGNVAEAFHLPVKIGDVSPWLVKATIAAEDRRFRRHPGVDALAVLRAAGQNVASGRRVSGASTITMQVIRLLRPRPRTYRAKCVEAFRALELERLADKDAVLELYLNLAPYGGNVTGAGAAAMRYFAKPASELTLGEAALLAGIPQSPARFNPGRHLDAAVRRRRYVLRRMRALGLADDDELRTAEGEPLAVVGRPRGTRAPHFTDYVLALRAGEAGVIRTTLDLGAQEVAARVVGRVAPELRRLGVDGAAAVVIDVERAELLAMVGSLDPDNPLTGQLNCAASRRQPGSLLKPFIYCAAFDTGLLTPGSVVYDAPSSWRGYRPRNIDRGFLGPVSAARALSESRNVPAVRLLGRLGVPRLARDMAALGIEVPAAQERCGLSLALGTAEVRLVDVANAYAALARLGEYRPLDAISGRSATSRACARKIYSPGAAYLVLRALGAARTPERARPAWKTGTSWDRRDAWAVVVTPRHVVAAWCGTLRGEGHPSLLGAGAALPIALDIGDGLPGKETAHWEAPPGVGTRRVCALSGAPGGPACDETRLAGYLPGVTSDAPCPLHRLRGRGASRRVETVWPGDVAAFLASSDGDQRSPSRDTPAAPSGGRPASRVVIVAPTDGAEYVIAGAAGEAASELSFRARGSRVSGDIYWFLDGTLLRRVPPGEDIRWPMAPGCHELVAADVRGASARVRFTVSRLAGR